MVETVKEGFYVISDGSKYIRKDDNGRWSRSSNKQNADKFTYEKATNIIKNGFSKEDRKTLIIETYIKPIKEQKTAAEEVSVQEDTTIFDSGDFNWGLMVKDLQKFYSNLLKYKSKIKQMRDNIEKEKCDLEHYIEFSEKINACEGYKMTKQYHDCRVRRRCIKDDELRIDILLESTIEDFANGRVFNRIMGIENRRYEPRILNELFEKVNQI